MRPRSAFTLIELLIVIAIMGILIATIAVAVTKALERAHLVACQHNLKQIGTALRVYESDKGYFPPVFPANPKPPYVGLVPNYFDTWSVLAQLNPYLEQTAIFKKMNLEQPLFTLPTLNITPDNQFAVQQVIKIFLCPADSMKPVGKGYGVPVLGPVNYAACIGSGTTDGGPPYGSPWNADGAFRASSICRIIEIADGVSNTAAFSESTLGDGPTMATGPMPGSPQKVYANVTSLTEARCDNANLWNVQQPRGYLWASGEIRCASYNHFYPPNSPKYDCVSNLSTPGQQQFTAVGFRAARSVHSGGVNVLFLDTSVHFISSAIDLGTWRALGTRSGSEPSVGFD